MHCKLRPLLLLVGLCHSTLITLFLLTRYFPLSLSLSLSLPLVNTLFFYTLFVWTNHQFASQCTSFFYTFFQVIHVDLLVLLLQSRLRFQCILCSTNTPWTTFLKTSTSTPSLPDCWKVLLVVVVWAQVLIMAYVVRGNRPGKQVQLAEHEIRFLCGKSRDIFMRYVKGGMMHCSSQNDNLKYSSQPILLDLEAPLKICGKWALFIKGKDDDIYIQSRH